MDSFDLDEPGYLHLIRSLAGMAQRMDAALIDALNAVF
jgi:hypothetical protein